MFSTIHMYKTYFFRLLAGPTKLGANPILNLRPVDRLSHNLCLTLLLDAALACERSFMKECSGNYQL